MFSLCILIKNSYLDLYMPVLVHKKVTQRLLRLKEVTY